MDEASYNTDRSEPIGRPLTLTSISCTSCGCLVFEDKRYEDQAGEKILMLLAGDTGVSET
jgi:hypothetical protein